jgi:tRNA(Glu) U13 pseudouridine synthase TruD
VEEAGMALDARRATEEEEEEEEATTLGVAMSMAAADRREATEATIRLVGAGMTMTTTIWSEILLKALRNTSLAETRTDARGVAVAEAGSLRQMTSHAAFVLGLHTMEQTRPRMTTLYRASASLDEAGRASGTHQKCLLF